MRNAKRTLLVTLGLSGLLLFTACDELYIRDNLPEINLPPIAELLPDNPMGNQTPPVSTPASPADAAFVQVMVHRIIDGDTIDVVMPDGEIERIRFIGVDAPEMGERGREEGAEPGAVEARDFVAERIPVGSTIWIEHYGGNDRCRWGRLRRYIWLSVPTDASIQRSETLNRLLLEYGHAEVWG